MLSRVPENRGLVRHRVRSDGRHRLRHQAALHPHQQHHPQLISIQHRLFNIKIIQYQEKNVLVTEEGLMVQCRIVDTKFLNN